MRVLRTIKESNEKYCPDLIRFTRTIYYVKVVSEEVFKFQSFIKKILDVCVKSNLARYHVLALTRY